MKKIPIHEMLDELFGLTLKKISVWNVIFITFLSHTTIKDYFGKQVQYKFYPKGILLDILILIDG